MLLSVLTHSHTMTTFDKPFEYIVGKGEIVCTNNFSFSHNVFYSIKGRNYLFWCIQFVVGKCVQFGLVQKFVMWEWVQASQLWLKAPFARVLPKGF